MTDITRDERKYTAPQQWEHLLLSYDWRMGSWKANTRSLDLLWEDLDYSAFNRLGEEGWELTTGVADNGRTTAYIFKRPKP